MGIPRILQAYQAQPWAIEPKKLEVLAGVLLAKAEAGQIPEASDIQALEVRQTERAQTAGAVAVLPLFGTISQRMNMIDAMSGGASIEIFTNSFREAMADEAIGTIVIQIDSPGGSVFGVEELSDLIFEARKTKRVIAVADAFAASAAYWIGSAADELVVTPSGEVGSIGVYMAHFDVSEQAEREGLRVTIIQAGANKTEGNPFEPLGEEAEAHLQSLVDAYYGSFVGAVARNRGVSVAKVEKDFGQGRTFTSRKALALGMVDRVATFDQVLEELLSGKPASRSRRVAYSDAAAAHALLEEVRRDHLAGKVSGSDLATYGDSIATAIAAVERKLLNTGDVKTTGLASSTPTEAPPEPARVAREDTMSLKDKAAQDSGAAPTIEEATRAAREAERERVRVVRSIGSDHSIAAETVDRWINDGVSEAGAQAAALEILRSRSATAPEIRVGSDREAEAPFASFGEQIECIIAAAHPDSPKLDPRLTHQNRVYAAATGMSQGSPADGGFVVAPSFSQVIWDGLNQDGVSLLSMTDSYPVEGDSLTFNANAETSRATGSRWGGVRAYWIAEAEQFTSSAPKFRQAKVEPQELAVLVYLTRKLMRNATSALEAYVTRAAIDEIAFMTDNAIIRGTGAGQPLGLLNSGSIVEVAKETGQAAATIVSENISKMWARLHPRARMDAVWLHNVDCEPEFDTLSVLVKNVAETENVGGYAPRVYNPETNTMKGRPVMPSEFCSTLGAAGDLILWSPSGYLAGIREGVDTDFSIHLRFDYAENVLRFMFEVDGQPWLASALTPFQGTNTLTTHVSLATRA